MSPFSELRGIDELKTCSRLLISLQVFSRSTKKGVTMRVIRAMEMKESRHGDEAPRGDEDCREDEKHFEGNVWLEAILPPIEPNGLRVYLVFFWPGARTNWHVHPEFQIMYVVAGKGRVESSDESGNKQAFEIAPGDIVRIKKERHWHGAAPDSFMIHIAINTGKTCWLEKVPDEGYQRGFDSG
jgi:quercetin dioxygenase-like cupin family protein